MALHLQHPRMAFIGTGQTLTVAGSGKNIDYVLSGDQGVMYSAAAHLTPRRSTAQSSLGHGPMCLWSTSGRQPTRSMLPMIC
jgi:hypothetical protein